MNNERIYQVLKGPVFSEKAQVLGETLWCSSVQS